MGKQTPLLTTGPAMGLLPFLSMSLAQTTIEQLRAEYSQNRLAFDMTCTVFLSGQHRAQLRQQIVTEVSGKIRPVNQCTVFEVAEILKATFEQLTLF